MQRCTTPHVQRRMRHPWMRQRFRTTGYCNIPISDYNNIAVWRRAVSNPSTLRAVASASLYQTVLHDSFRSDFTGNLDVWTFDRNKLASSEQLFGVANLRTFGTYLGVYTRRKPKQLCPYASPARPSVHMSLKPHVLSSHWMLLTITENTAPWHSY
eukprot:m.29603 g.29603  ORF g.29603 m.29603 type:complete len:156 (-) comp13755_c0_seq1:408-875(-)